MEPFNAERAEELASEYRIGYRQLRLAEQKLEEGVELLGRDVDLARLRYEAARREYLELALGKGQRDEFIEVDEEG